MIINNINIDVINDEDFLSGKTYYQLNVSKLKDLFNKYINENYNSLYNELLKEKVENIISADNIDYIWENRYKLNDNLTSFDIIVWYSCLTNRDGKLFSQIFYALNDNSDKMKCINLIEYEKELFNEIITKDLKTKGIKKL